MIWWIIGYVLMGFISGVLYGLYPGWIARGRDYDIEKFLDCILHFATEGEMKYVNENSSWVIIIAIGLFNTVFWPVKLIRMIFLYVPDAIEFYETHYVKGEEA